jgi:hypothetical protein
MDDFWSVLLRGPLTVVRPETVGVPVVVAATEAGTLVTYEQTVGEGDERETLTSERDGRFLMGGRSRWRLEGGGSPLTARSKGLAWRRRTTSRRSSSSHGWTSTPRPRSTASYRPLET